VTALSDGTVPINLHELLRDTTPEEVDRLFARSFLTDPVEASIIAFLVEEGSRRVLESDGDQIEFWGDLIHIAQVQFPRPSITIAFDVDRSAAARQRAAQLDQAARGRNLVAAPHQPFPGVGHLRAESEGYTWVPLPYRDRAGK
jgi:hypothetical protein